MRYKANKPIGLALVLAGVLVLSGCATLSRDECKVADWYTIGYEDGLAGKPATRIAEHRKACAEYGIAPDLGRYMAGRNKGLETYCLPSNGFRRGVSGASFANVCPDRLASLFQAAYSEGRAIYDARNHVHKLKRKLDSKIAQYKTLENDVQQYERELIERGTTPRRRIILLDEIRNSQDEAAKVHAQIHGLEDRLAEARAHLTDLTDAAHKW